MRGFAILSVLATLAFSGFAAAAPSPADANAMVAREAAPIAQRDPALGLGDVLQKLHDDCVSPADVLNGLHSITSVDDIKVEVQKIQVALEVAKGAINGLVGKTRAEILLKAGVAITVNVVADLFCLVFTLIAGVVNHLLTLTTDVACLDLLKILLQLLIDILSLIITILTALGLHLTFILLVVAQLLLCGCLTCFVTLGLWTALSALLPGLHL